jgi:hypothetical protein
MDIPKTQLGGLVDMTDASVIFDEVRTVLGAMFPAADLSTVETVFADLVKVHSGEYPGYREANTEYHDLLHTMGTTLALVRLAHGASLAGSDLDERHVTLATMSALFHDVGYVQVEGDTSGTGAKYTAVHVERSIIFMRGYFLKSGFSQPDFMECSRMIQCTSLDTRPGDVPFESKEIEVLGRMLGAADLLGQMADRMYLEKLLLLYYEFKEGGVGGYKDQLDLLRRSVDFYDISTKRIRDQLPEAGDYFRRHFKERWDLNEDLYGVSMERGRQYLDHILSEREQDHRSLLRRGGIVQRLEEEGR